MICMYPEYLKDPSVVNIMCHSGGMDSTFLLWMAVRENLANIQTIRFKYNSKHNELERNRAEQSQYVLHKKYNHKSNLIGSGTIDVSAIFKASGGASALISPSITMPAGHYREENMRQTVVPGRNTVFAACLLSIAEGIMQYDTKITRVAVHLGIHSGDHFIYPDCRPDWARSISNVFSASSNGKVTLETPLLYKDKIWIVRAAKELDMLDCFQMTNTCYNPVGSGVVDLGEEMACGVCGACQERLEAFAFNKVSDPLVCGYVSRELLPKKESI